MATTIIATVLGLSLVIIGFVLLGQEVKGFPVNYVNDFYEQLKVLREVHSDLFSKVGTFSALFVDNVAYILDSNNLRITLNDEEVTGKTSRAEFTSLCYKVYSSEFEKCKEVSDLNFASFDWTKQKFKF